MFSGPQRGFPAARNVTPAAATSVKAENGACDAQNASATPSVPAQAAVVPRPWPPAGPRNFGPQKFSIPQKPTSPFCPKIGYMSSVFNGPTWPIPQGTFPGVVPFNLVTDSSSPGAFDTANSAFTVPCKGFFHFDFVVEILNVAAVGNPTVTLTLAINNIARVPILYSAADAGDVDSVTGCWQGILEAGDVVTLRGLAAQGSGATVQGSAVADVFPYPTSFSAWWFLV